MMRADGKCYVIAEAGVAHGGDMATAIAMVRAAKTASADACKFQLFNAEMCKDELQRELLRPLQLTNRHHERLYDQCAALGIDYLASVFDCDMVDFAADLGCKVVKVGSGEITNLPMLTRIRERNLGAILSTGMSDVSDVMNAVLQTSRYAALLHCTSNYPTEPAHCNMLAMQSLRRDFNLPVGFSDHTIGPDAAVMAIAMGATIIEKHFMLEPGCPDEAVSITPDALRGYVATIRRAELMMGTGEKVLQPGEEEMRKVARGRWG